MHRLLVISADRDDPATVTREPSELEITAAEPGEVVSSVVLARSADAKTVRVREGIRTVTDGPSAECTELIVGYHVTVSETLERATQLAATIHGTWPIVVEVRPLMRHAGLEM
jgi:hypothetical protein